MISIRFQGKPFNITVIQVYALTSNAKEAEVEWFYEDLQDLVELTPQNDVLFIIGDLNANVGSQETPGKSEVSQSCLTFCDPIDCSPPGSSVHGIFPGKDSGVGCHFLLQGNLPGPGMEPRSPALAGRVFTEHLFGHSLNRELSLNAILLSKNIASH